MKEQIELNIPPEKITDKDHLYSEAAKKSGHDPVVINAVQTLRRSLDARSRNPFYRVIAEIYVNEEPPKIHQRVTYKPVESKKEVIIVGSGPAGLFSAFSLLSWVLNLLFWKEVKMFRHAEEI
jgi:uncharacterized protein